MHHRLSIVTSLALTAAALTPVADAQQRRSVDEDVYFAFQAAGALGASAHTHDADWTADGDLAICFVEGGGSSNELVVGLHSPVHGTWTLLGRFHAPGWLIGDVSLAVPGVTYGDAEFDRIYVALEAQAWLENREQTGKSAKAVRCISIAMDGSESTVRAGSPPNLELTLTGTLLELPAPEVTLTPDGSWSALPEYAIDLAFTDPLGEDVFIDNVPLPGHLMATRSYDRGHTFEPARYVTGPNAMEIDGLDPSVDLRAAGKTKPALAGDPVSRRALIAFQHEADRRVHVIERAYDAADYLHFWSSDEGGDHELEPRIACGGEGDIVLTALSPASIASTRARGDWWTGSYFGGLLPNAPFADYVSSRIDVDVRGGDAFMAALARVDGSSAFVAAAFQGNMSQRGDVLSGVPFLDDDRKALHPPIVGCAPDDGFGPSAFFVRTTYGRFEPATLVMDR